MSAQTDLFRIREEDDGERFALDGELSFASVGIALKNTAKLLASSTETVFDLAGIARADSAGVALLLEWRRRAKEAGIKLHYVNLPPQLLAIARVAGVDDLLCGD
ncbi:MAG TPA: STAS domain-containing protein [Methylococcaceae bacterium]|jgi:phospholipid transport system transporter-binding protein|nr:STAS domain-containing protein [Methylococcaceae bacterium]